MAYKHHSDVIKYYRKWRVLNRAKLNFKSRQRYKRNPEKEKLRHKIWASQNKNRLRKYVRQFRNKNKSRINENQRNYRASVKHEVFMRYGGYQCVCCGETEKIFLTIDHIYKSGKSPYERQQLYMWLKRQNFPEGFRVLCFNCNLGRNRNKGICPHGNL